MDHPDVNYSLICAVRAGRLEKVRELINSFGLSYSKAWEGGYVLLCDAINNEHAAVAKLLLRSGSKVNSKNTKPTNTALHYAAINGDIKIVKMILDRGAKIDAKNQYSRTPLHIAIENTNMEVAELLLKHKADVNARDQYGISPLHIAVKRECLQTVKHLLTYGAYVNYCYPVCKNNDTPLHFAVENGSKEIVMLLLSRGANVNVKGQDSITPLHIAAQKGYVHIAENLLNQGACTHSLTLREEYTPLHFASELGNEAAVELFLNRGADINASTKGNVTPLYIATKMGHTTVVRLLLQRGAKVDSEDKDGKTVLHLAVEKGYLMIVEDVLKYCPDINNQSNRRSLEIAMYGHGEEYKKIVEALLEYGLIVNHEAANNSKLLHLAVKKGYLKIVEDLLKYGADVNMLYESTFEKGFTPLHRAAKHNQEEVAKLLISYEADVNALDKTGKTPIFYAIKNADLKMTKLLLINRANKKGSPELLNIAVRKKCIEIIEALLHHDADINASDKYGQTALHCTALSEMDNFFEFLPNKNSDNTIKGEIAKLLLSKGADVNSRTKNGETALYVAIKNGYKEVVEVLLECGAEINSKIKGDTPLHLAAKKDYWEIVETILKSGADINSKDEYGRTALHIASHEGHTEVVATLLEYGSDINITSRKNRTPLDLAMAGIRSFYRQLDYYDSDDDYYDVDRGVCSCEQTAEILRCHIVKMKTANLYISEKNLLSMSSCVGVNDYDFQENCEEEIASMKSEKINNANISFYDILAKDTSSLAIYMRNENIVQALKSDDYKTKFPIYASMIGSNFRKGMERKELLQQGNAICHFLFNNFSELPHGCTEKIFSYLGNEDLRKLIDGFKPFSIGTPNINDADE